MTGLTGAKVRATVAVSDRGRARLFYGETLGLTLESDGAEAATYSGANGTVLDVYQSDYAGTAKSTVASFEVSDVDGAVADLRARGVAFDEYDAGDGAKRTVVERGGVRGAWFRDPDGNILGLIQLTATG